MASNQSCSNYPPPNYQVPRFPSLCWPPHACLIYTIYDSWRFTLIWTLNLFIAFHLSAIAIALLMQVGKPRSIWKYLGAVPVIYTVVAGVEALVAGSIVGSVLGAVYIAACYKMSTWIPFVWGLINVLVLIISSFTIQGGL
ncbi:integral membrane protein [Xylaria sp. FL1777]|nr:integral membrane protein [Xylaria sp. FL1777]